ncbi:MAG: hypothetical protein WCT18_04025 [Patescibacteria group bacterium]
MTTLETFFTILLGIQAFHSIEKLSTGFHEKFPLFKMKWITFLIIEIIWVGLWIGIFLYKELEYRDYLLSAFNIIVFGFGVWEFAWWGIVKKYVPGLIAGFMYIISFLIFYFKVLF